MKKIFLLISLLLLLPSIAFGATYYVDATLGADTNVGTEAAPWANAPGMDNCSDNCESAESTLTGNDTVKLKRNEVWRQTLTMLQSGTDTNSHITYDAYGTGAKPLIRMSEEVSSWTEEGTTGVFRGSFGVSGLFRGILNPAKTSREHWYVNKPAYSGWDAGYFYGGRNGVESNFWFKVDGSRTSPGTREVGRRLYGINTNGKDHITIRNIAIYGPGFSTSPDIYCNGIYVQGSTDIKLDAVDVRFVSNNAVRVSQSDSIYVDNSYVYQSNNGVYFAYNNSNTYSRIYKTIIEDISTIAGDAGDGHSIGVWTTPNLDVLSNRVIGSGYNDGLEAGRVSHAVVGAVNFSGDDEELSGWETSGSNIWYASLVNEPYLIAFNSTFGTHETGSCPGDLNVDQEWCWSSGTLYQYSTSDPDTRYTSDGTNYLFATPSLNPNYNFNCKITGNLIKNIGGTPLVVSIFGTYDVLGNVIDNYGYYGTAYNSMRGMHLSTVQAEPQTIWYDTHIVGNLIQGFSGTADYLTAAIGGPYCNHSNFDISNNILNNNGDGYEIVMNYYSGAGAYCYDYRHDNNIIYHTGATPDPGGDDPVYYLNVDFLTAAELNTKTSGTCGGDIGNGNLPDNPSLTNYMPDSSSDPSVNAGISISGLDDRLHMDSVWDQTPPDVRWRSAIGTVDIGPFEWSLYTACTSGCDFTDIQDCLDALDLDETTCELRADTPGGTRYWHITSGLDTADTAGDYVGLRGRAGDTNIIDNLATKAGFADGDLDGEWTLSGVTVEPNFLVWNGTPLERGEPGSLANNQWGWVGNILYVKPDPTGATIQVNESVSILLTSSVDNFTISNFDFMYADSAIYSYNNGVTIEDVNFRYFTSSFVLRLGAQSLLAQDDMFEDSTGDWTGNITMAYVCEGCPSPITDAYYTFTTSAWGKVSLPASLTAGEEYVCWVDAKDGTASNIQYRMVVFDGTTLTQNSTSWYTDSTWRRNFYQFTAQTDEDGVGIQMASASGNNIRFNDFYCRQVVKDGTLRRLQFVDAGKGPIRMLSYQDSTFEDIKIYWDNWLDLTGSDTSVNGQGIMAYDQSNGNTFNRLDIFRTHDMLWSGAAIKLMLSDANTVKYSGLGPWMGDTLVLAASKNNKVLNNSFSRTTVHQSHPLMVLSNGQDTLDACGPAWGSTPTSCGILSSGNEIRNNIWYNVRSDSENCNNLPFGCGFFHTSCSAGSLQPGVDSTNTFSNNLYYSEIEGTPTTDNWFCWFEQGKETEPNTKYTYAEFADPITGHPEYFTDTVYADPRYLDKDNANLRLMTNSPAINAGYEVADLYGRDPEDTTWPYSTRPPITSPSIGAWVWVPRDSVKSLVLLFANHARDTTDEQRQAIVDNYEMTITSQIRQNAVKEDAMNAHKAFTSAMKTLSPDHIILAHISGIYTEDNAAKWTFAECAASGVDLDNSGSLKLFAHSWPDTPNVAERIYRGITFTDSVLMDATSSDWSDRIIQWWSDLDDPNTDGWFLDSSDGDLGLSAHICDDDDPQTDVCQPNILVQGYFAEDSGWTYNTPPWTVDAGDNGKAVCDGTQIAETLLTQTAPPLTNGVTYRARLQVYAWNAGNVNVRLGTVNGAARSSTGSFEEYIESDGSAFSVAGDADFDGSLEQVLVDNQPSCWVSSTAWFAEVGDHLDRVKTGMGTDLVTYNGFRSWYDDVVVNACGADCYADSTDGAAIEGFVFQPYYNEEYDKTRAEEDIDLLIRGIAAGYTVMAVPKTETELAEWKRKLAFASFLLGKGEKAYYYYMHGDLGNADYYPEYGLDIGVPAGTAPTELADLEVIGQDDLYAREYTGGLVLVNLGDAPRTYANSTVRYSLTPIGGGLVGTDGIISGTFHSETLPASDITVPPESALILSNDVLPESSLCNYTITSETSSPYDGSGIPAGSTICIDSTRTTPIAFEDLDASAGFPITITNYGQVNIVNNGSDQDILLLTDCQNVRILGNGHGYTNIISGNYHPLYTGVSWAAGIKLSAGSKRARLKIADGDEIGDSGSDDIEIGYIEIDGSTGDPTTGGHINFSDDNEGTHTASLHVHHFKITGGIREGMYIGHSGLPDCGQSDFDNVLIEDGWVQDADWDGIQVDCVSSGSLIIRRVYLHNIGAAEIREPADDCLLLAGCGRSGIILLNEVTTNDVQVYQNYVHNVSRYGIVDYSNSTAPTKIWGNGIIGAGFNIAHEDCDNTPSTLKSNADGISCQNETSGCLIYNNAVTSECDGIAVTKDIVGSEVKNNVVISNYTTGADYESFAFRVNYNSTVSQYNVWYSPYASYVIRNAELNEGAGQNFTMLEQSTWQALGYTNDLFADPFFVDIASGNFLLKSGSPAINSGANLGDPYNEDIRGYDQDDFGSWERGAYVYFAPPGSRNVILRGNVTIK